MADPSAKRILHHIQGLDRIIMHNEQQLRRMEIEEKGTSSSEIPAAFTIRKNQLLAENARLLQGRRYWQAEFDKTLAKMKANGASILPRAPGPAPDPLYGRRITPEELDLRIPAPYYEPLPIPRYEPGDEPDDTVFPGYQDDETRAGWSEKHREKYEKLKRDWIAGQWIGYWTALNRARENYWYMRDLWSVEKYFWEQRRRKALRDGRPFTEAPPMEPKMPHVPVPNAPLPPKDFKI